MDNQTNGGSNLTNWTPREAVRERRDMSMVITAGLLSEKVNYGKANYSFGRDISEYINSCSEELLDKYKNLNINPATADMVSNIVNKTERSFITNIILKAMSEVYKSDIIIWRAPIWKAATAGYESFKGLKMEDEYRPAFQFWITDGYYTADQDDIADLDTECTLNCFFIIPIIMRNDALFMYEPGDKDKDIGLLVLSPFMPTRQDLPDSDIARVRYTWSGPGKVITSSIATHYAARLFLEQDFVTTEKIQPNRAQRKQAQRRNEHIQEIGVVTLRRSSHKNEGGGGNVQHEVEWKHHWLVRGHWRKPSPQMKEPRPVYVRPHSKGDFDKPLLPPKESVYVASR